MASPGTDIAFSEARTEGYRAFANKIWNAARFLFMNVDRAREAGYNMTMRESGIVPSLPDDTPLETRWIFSRLAAVSAEVDRALADYRFDEAANAIYQFFWGEFCDWYLELAKLRLDFTEGAEKNPTTALTLASLVGVFESALRLLSPFMPFLTEEIWHALYEGKPPAKSIALTRYPQANDFPIDPIAESAMKTLQDLIVTVRGLRKELGVPEKESTPITIHAGNRVIALADANGDVLSRMARVAAVEFANESLTGGNARSTADFDVAVIYERQIDVTAERERLTKDLAKYEKGLASADKQLNNDTFMSKAPAHIVDGLRKQHAETKVLHDKTKAALDSLPSA
jgi:valyl-tRNA synthetase